MNQGCSWVSSLSKWVGLEDAELGSGDGENMIFFWGGGRRDHQTISSIILAQSKVHYT